MFSRSSLLVAAALAACCAAALPAQTLRGRVIDAATGEPVGQVRVELLRADSSPAEQRVTDPTGRFIFTLAAGGSYRLRVRHVAYLPVLTQTLQLGPQEELVADLRITAVPIELDPLTVIARRQDARNDATADGMYARYRLFPPLGNRRVFLPHDPEMVNAIDISDILLWSLRARGCRIVYWNGILQSDPTAAAWRMEMPVALLEAVEYYRTLADAPLEYRDVPGYLAAAGCATFHVVALWPRTGRYAYEVEPHYTPEPAPWYPRAALVAYHVSGRAAPGIGAGIELSSHTQLSRNIQLGIVARGTFHRLSAATTHALTSTLTDVSYVLPPGRRGLQLWVLGGDLRVTPVQRADVRVTASVRVQAAQRRFSLESPVVYQGSRAVTSYGFGAGLTVGTEFRVGRRTLATMGLGHDRYRFRKYEEIERSYNPTAARWSATSLRIGLIHTPTRE